MTLEDLKNEVLILDGACALMENTHLLLTTTSGADFYAEVLELRTLLKEQIAATELKSKENEAL